MSFILILEVLIGLAFTYLVLSLIVTWINEWIVRALKWRAKNLETAIGNLFKDPEEYFNLTKKKKEEFRKDHPNFEPFIEKFYGHGAVKVLGKEKIAKEQGRIARIFGKPKESSETASGVRPGKASYIPARTVATVALNILFSANGESEEEPTPIKDDNLLALIKKVPNRDTREAFRLFYHNGANTVEKLSSDVETWFDDTMDRLNGWYKRRMVLLSLCLGFILAVALNVDSIVVTQALWREPTLRASIVDYFKEHPMELTPPGIEGETSKTASESEATASETLAEDEGEENDGEIIDQITDVFATLELPAGWTDYGPRGEFPLWWGLKRLPGWVLTAVMVSQGAPFWFDLLGKLVNMRNTGEPPKKEEKKKDESGEDE